MNTISHFTTLFLAFTTLQLSPAAVLTFEELPAPNTFVCAVAPIPDGYGGLNWNSTGIGPNNSPGQGAGYFTKGTLIGGYNAGVVGSQAAVTWFANDIVMEGAPFTFNSACITAARVTHLVTVTGYSAAKVYSQTIQAVYAQSNLFTFNFVNVTNVTIHPGTALVNDNNIVLDNITIYPGIGSGVVDSDADGVPDAVDAFPHSRDVGSSVVIEGVDTGVPNRVFADGSTISDLVYEIAAEAKNHGQFVSGVAQLKNQLRKDAVITAAEAAAIQAGTAEANLP